MYIACPLLFSMGYSLGCLCSLVLLEGLPMYVNLYAFPKESCVHAVVCGATVSLDSSVAPAHTTCSCSIVSKWPDLVLFFVMWRSLPVWMSRDLFNHVLATSPVFLRLPFIHDFYLLFIACVIIQWQQPTLKLLAAQLVQGQRKNVVVADSIN